MESGAVASASPLREELFLWLMSGTASRKLSTVCSLVLWQGQISSQKSDAQARLPSHITTRGKRLHKRRLQCTHPSRPQHWFHVYPTSSEVLPVPKPCDRYVRLQLVCFSENQGLSAKNFHLTIIRDNSQILAFLLINRFELSKNYFGVRINLKSGLHV
jgi:hypothetical protein